MDEDIGEQNAERGEVADLGERRKAADEEKREADRRGEHREQPQSPDLPRSLEAARLVRPVQKKEIGYAVVDRE